MTSQVLFKQVGKQQQQNPNTKAIHSRADRTTITAIIASLGNLRPKPRSMSPVGISLKIEWFSVGDGGIVALERVVVHV